MIMICNDTTMAEVLDRYVADRGQVSPELKNTGRAQHTIRIDSKLLATAEERIPPSHRATGQNGCAAWSQASARKASRAKRSAA